MSDTQEARDRHRQMLAVEGIMKYLGELIPIMREINKTLEDFAKIAAPAKVELVKPDVELAKQRALHTEAGE